MATTSPVYGWPLPDLTDSPNAPQEIADLVDGIEATISSDVAVHAAYAYRSNGDGDSGTIPDSAWTSVALPTESIDTDAYHSTSSNTSRITVPTGLAGYYICGITARFDSVAAGTQRGVGIDTNGNGNFFAIQMHTEPSGGFNSSHGPTLSAVGFTHLADGDYVQFNAFQDSGSPMVLKQAFNSPALWAVRIPFA